MVRNFEKPPWLSGWPSLRGMSSVLDAVSQQARPLAPVPRLAVALTAAGLAVACLLSGLSYPEFPIDIAACGVFSRL